MRLRSLLFVPGDRPDRIAKATGGGADAVILDFEDSVAAGAKAAARASVAAALGGPRYETAMIVRINALDTGMLDADLDAIVPARPAAIMLPKCEGASGVALLSKALSARGDHETAILPIAAETPLSAFRLAEFAGCDARLLGLTWGAEDLQQSLGSDVSRDQSGQFTGPFELVRNLTLHAAAAAGVPAIETVFPAFRDTAGAMAAARRAARDGFSGMLAIHPCQVPLINAAFTPTAEAVGHARDVVAAFEASPGAGVLTLDGKMIDQPHLKRALRILARAS